MLLNVGNINRYVSNEYNRHGYLNYINVFNREMHVCHIYALCGSCVNVNLLPKLFTITLYPSYRIEVHNQDLLDFVSLTGPDITYCERTVAVLQMFAYIKNQLYIIA